MNSGVDKVHSTLLVRREGAVAWLSLNRPERRNAISSEMRAELKTQLGELGSDDSVRVVVLTGSGSVFCAGVDLSERSERPPHVDALRSEPVAKPIEGFEKPLVAAINGAAIGGGLELALAADLRIAATTASFALPEVQLGSLPGSGGTQRLIRVMLPGAARKAIFTGEPFDAAEAYRCGLVCDVVEPEELVAATQKLAAQIARNSPLSLRAAKIALSSAADESDGLVLERALWGLLSVSADRAEGRAAFRERRPPNFLGS